MEALAAAADILCRPKQGIETDEKGPYGTVVIVMMIRLVLGVPTASAETVTIGYFRLPPLQCADKVTHAAKGASRVYFERWSFAYMSIP